VIESSAGQFEELLSQTKSRERAELIATLMQPKLRSTELTCSLATSIAEIISLAIGSAACGLDVTTIRPAAVC
jgi:hypothetical protein